MDYQRFITQLPDLYENWGQDSVRPKSDKFQNVLEQVQGLTTANVLQLLNFAVDCLEPKEVYCEVGSFLGSTLIGALLDHPDKKAIAIDNFSQFNEDGDNFKKMSRNIVSFGFQKQINFCTKEFEEFFCKVQRDENGEKIGVYFYDGTHDYRSQLLGLMLAKPFFADQALIIVDDTNWSAVKQANSDFIAAHYQCKPLLELSTPETRHHTFWNGIQVLLWDKNADFALDWETVDKNRNLEFIKAIAQVDAKVDVLHPLSII